MQKSLDSYKSDLAKIRTGRAHTGLLDHIQLPIAVFNIFKSGALKNILLGQNEGTLVMPNIH